MVLLLRLSPLLPLAASNYLCEWVPLELNGLGAAAWQLRSRAADGEPALMSRGPTLLCSLTDGLTSVDLGSYVLGSWLGMLPGAGAMLLGRIRAAGALLQPAHDAETKAIRSIALAVSQALPHTWQRGRTASRCWRVAASLWRVPVGKCVRGAGWRELPYSLALAGTASLHFGMLACIGMSSQVLLCRCRTEFLFVCP